MNGHLPGVRTHGKTRVVGDVYQFLDAFQEVSGDTTMGIQQVMVLLALYIQGELNQHDLAGYAKIDKTSVSRNIGRLGAGVKPSEMPGPGWVESYEDLVDRRLKKVRLTGKGRAMIEAVVDRAAG